MQVFYAHSECKCLGCEMKPIVSHHISQCLYDSLYLEMFRQNYFLFVSYVRRYTRLVKTGWSR
jgi:hypothetical protein